MKKFVCTSLFLVAGLTIASAQQVKLSINPEKGKKYEYQTETTQNVKQSVAGQEFLVEMETNTRFLQEIKDKTPQEITVQYTYQDMAYIVSSPMVKMFYDSKTPSENPSDIDQMLSKMFGKMMGQSFVAVYAPDGSVKSLIGMDRIAESMVDAIAGDGPMIAQLGAQMKQQFNDEVMKNMFEQSFKIYPDNAVKPGDTWNKNLSTTVNNMSTGFKTKYTLKSVSKNVATITFSSEIEMNPPAEMGMEGKISGTQTGTMTVDTKTGLPLTLNANQEITGALKVQGMDVQMELNTKTKGTIKEI